MNVLAAIVAVVSAVGVALLGVVSAILGGWHLVGVWLCSVLLGAALGLLVAWLLDLVGDR